MGAPWASAIARASVAHVREGEGEGPFSRARAAGGKVERKRAIRKVEMLPLPLSICMISYWKIQMRSKWRSLFSAFIALSTFSICFLLLCIKMEIETDLVSYES